MKTLADRIRYVVEQRDDLGGAEGWSVKAGLTLGHISSFYARAAKDPDAGMHQRSIDKLAKAAGVPIAWLSQGAGKMTDAGADATVEPIAVDPRTEGERLFLEDVEARTAHRFPAAREWMAQARQVHHMGTGNWGRTVWFRYYLDEWDKFRKGSQLGVVIPAPVDEDAAAKVRAEKLAAARARKG